MRNFRVYSDVSYTVPPLNSTQSPYFSIFNIERDDQSGSEKRLISKLGE